MWFLNINDMQFFAFRNFQNKTFQAGKTMISVTLMISFKDTLSLEITRKYIVQNLN
jgi:hypothetical protein